METNGGPVLMKEDEQYPLKRYRTTLYTSTDDDISEQLPITEQRADGLNLHQTLLLLAGYFPGFAATILLVAIIHTGWVGFLVVAFLIFLLAYSAKLLSNCWNMIYDVSRFDDLNPYGAIAFEAFGSWARILVNVLVDLVSFGGTAAMILAMSELVLIVIGSTLKGSYCYWPLIIGAVMCPTIWVGIPKNIWQLGALSIITTLFALLLIFIDAAIHLERNEEYNQDFQPPLKIWAYGKLMAGTIFLLGGHFVYPEIQKAMKEPGKFDRSTLTMFLLIALFLFPVLLVVFVSYGGTIVVPWEVEGSLLRILPRDGMVVIPGLLLLINSAPVMLIFINPLFQHLDGVFGIPEEFGWKRILMRTIVIILLVFLAETVPDFAILMTVVGGILLPFLTFLAPALCYLQLRSMHMSNSWQERPKMHFFETIVSILIIVAAVAIVVSVLVITVLALVNNEVGYVKPCYVQFNQTYNGTVNATDF